MSLAENISHKLGQWQSYWPPLPLAGLFTEQGVIYLSRYCCAALLSSLQGWDWEPREYLSTRHHAATLLRFSPHDCWRAQPWNICLCVQIHFLNIPILFLVPNVRKIMWLIKQKADFMWTFHTNTHTLSNWSLSSHWQISVSSRALSCLEVISCTKVHWIAGFFWSRRCLGC